MPVPIKRCDECEHCNPPTVDKCEECGSARLCDDEASTELDCDHCGDVAVESKTGLFGEGMADKCMSCGYPGHVSVYDASATWVLDDDDWAARCTQKDCDGCRDLDKEDLENAVEMLHRALPILEGTWGVESRKLVADIVARWGRGEILEPAQKPEPKG